MIALRYQDSGPVIQGIHPSDIEDDPENEDLRPEPGWVAYGPWEQYGAVQHDDDLFILWQRLTKPEGQPE